MKILYGCMQMVVGKSIPTFNFSFLRDDAIHIQNYSFKRWITKTIGRNSSKINTFYKLLLLN